jgi:hypothetical protein
MRLERVLDGPGRVAFGHVIELVDGGDAHALPGRVRDRVEGEHGASDLDEPGDQQDDDREDERELHEALAVRAGRAAAPPRAAAHVAHGALLRTVIPLVQVTVVPTVRLCQAIR